MRSRELRAVTLLGRAFKYQLDCQEIWRQLYFLRFSTAFGKFKSWKLLYIQVRRSVDRLYGLVCAFCIHTHPESNIYMQRDERCDRIKTWRAFFERSRQQQQLQVRVVELLCQRIDQRLSSLTPPRLPTHPQAA